MANTTLKRVVMKSTSIVRVGRDYDGIRPGGASRGRKSGGGFEFSALDVPHVLPQDKGRAVRPARPIGHPKFVKHTLPELLRQRVFGIAMGYEDVNDHDSLRRDPMMALGVGKADPLGLDCPGIDRGRALAGKSTLNRLELANARTGPGPVRVAHRILADHAAIERLLVRLAVSRLAPGTEAVVLDFDATDSPLHGGQEGRFFHGYYDACCYLPLYCFIGPWPVWAQLRTSNREFEYRTAKSWIRARRVIGKAQVSPRGGNPRFIVTNLPPDREPWKPERLYREF